MFSDASAAGKTCAIMKRNEARSGTRTRQAESVRRSTIVPSLGKIYLRMASARTPQERMGHGEIPPESTSPNPQNQGIVGYRLFMIRVAATCA